MTDMDLKELMKLQRIFDSNHKSTNNWFTKINEKNLETFEFLIVSIMGELGEISNIVKKVRREDLSFDSKIK